jgi:hypothetical protein
MSHSLQFSKRLQAPPPLATATGIKKPELRAHRLGQLTAVKELVAFEQLANVAYVRRLRQRPLNLVLCVHAARMHGMQRVVQHLFTGKGHG